MAGETLGTRGTGPLGPQKCRGPGQLGTWGPGRDLRHPACWKMGAFRGIATGGGGGEGGYSYPPFFKSGGDVPTRFENEVAQIRCLFWFLGYLGVGGHTANDSSPLKKPWWRPGRFLTFALVWGSFRPPPPSPVFFENNSKTKGSSVTKLGIPFHWSILHLL